MATMIGLDAKLNAGRKTLRTLPGALLLGSTGARLWADYLEAKPGFSGRFDFIHKINIPLLFRIDNNLVEQFEPCKTEWMPSHLHMEYANNRLSFQDDKFITWDDVAVSCQTWTNHSGEDLVLRLATYESAFKPVAADTLFGGFDIEHYTFDVDLAIVVSEPALLDGFVIKPGETRQIVVAAAGGIRGQDGQDTLIERARAFAGTGQLPAQVLDRHVKEYEQWFALTPQFSSSDELLNRTWLYRWFLLRHNLADPRYGYLKYPLFYEGRSHKKSKTPFGKGGWEFSKLINLSVPLHLMDARWYHDPKYCEGSLLNMAESQNEENMFCCLTVDTIMHSFANFGVWAAYELYLVHRDTDVMKRLLPEFKQQIESWKNVYGTGIDELMIEWRHTRTGKEYQPSYWYFHDYPKNPKDKTTYTHVKRVDRTIYHYLNTLGVAKFCEEFGDPEAAKFYELADNIKRDVLDKMWDEETEFFYDLHYQTDEKAWVKNIVGFYPYWAEITDDRHAGMINHLFNKEEFNTRCPFPSVSADNPVYAPGGGWQGLFIKGVNGCVWNGPTWPYTNAITLDALARESKRTGHRYDREFGHYLREYSFLHFSKRDLAQPYLVEHYNSSTGEPISDEPEYNHSYYIDLIIRHVAGLTVKADRLVLDPVEVGLDFFNLDQIKVAGADLRITWKRPGASGAPGDLEDGYRLYVNGKQVFVADTLSRTELPLDALK